MLTDKILLIDDDPEEFDIFCNTVTGLDRSIGCLIANNCSEGFQMLSNSNGLPRYIFLDLNMPGSNGKYCLERIKKHPKFRSIPVFIYTTSDREADKAEAKKLGAEMFITKPDTEKELKKILLYVISEEWKYN